MQHLNKIPVARLLGLLLAVGPILTHAADWSSIIKKQDYEIFVDIDSYKMEDGYPSIVSKTVFNHPQNKILKPKKTQFVVSESHQQFNCKTPVYRTSLIKFFNKKKQLKGTEHGATEFQAIVAGSNEFSIRQLVCQVHQMVGGQ